MLGWCACVHCCTLPSPTDSMWTPPGLQVDSIWKRPQSTILYKIHLDSIWTPYGIQMESKWTPGGLQVDSSTCIITKKYQYFSLLQLFLLESYWIC